MPIVIKDYKKYDFKNLNQNDCKTIVKTYALQINELLYAYEDLLLQVKLANNQRIIVIEE